MARVRGSPRKSVPSRVASAKNALPPERSRDINRPIPRKQPFQTHDEAPSRSPRGMPMYTDSFADPRASVNDWYAQHPPPRADDEFFVINGNSESSESDLLFDTKDTLDSRHQVRRERDHPNPATVNFMLSGSADHSPILLPWKEYERVRAESLGPAKDGPTGRHQEAGEYGYRTMTRGLGMFDYTVPGMKDQQEPRNSGQSSPIFRPISTDSEVNEIHLGTHPLDQFNAYRPISEQQSRVARRNPRDLYNATTSETQNQRYQLHSIWRRHKLCGPSSNIDHIQSLLGLEAHSLVDAISLVQAKDEEADVLRVYVIEKPKDYEEEGMFGSYPELIGYARFPQYPDFLEGGLEQGGGDMG